MFYSVLFSSLLLSVSLVSGCSPSSSSNKSGGATLARPAVSTFNFGENADYPPLRNQEGIFGKVRGTGLVVMSGDKIEIRPSCLYREKRKVLDPQVTRVNNDVCMKMSEVCVATEPVFERRCDEECRFCVKCQAFPPACIPWRCCDNVCHNVQVGERCVRSEPRCVQSENQWREISVFGGIGESEMTKQESPMQDATPMSTGLVIRLSPIGDTSSTQERSCALNFFKPKVDVDVFSFVLKNVEGCQTLFSNEETEQAFLSLGNEMDNPIQYLQGTIEKTWDGRTFEQAEQKTYSPIIDFMGTLTVHAKESF